jgi:hypothetical protein
MDPGERQGAERNGAEQWDASEEHHEPAHDEIGYGTAELCIYELPEGTRLLSAQRVGEAVHVSDRPLGHPGKTYLVETAVSSLSELIALAEDYRAQADALGDCPMRAGAIDAGGSSHEREAIS